MEHFGYGDIAYAQRNGYGYAQDAAFTTAEYDLLEPGPSHMGQQQQPVTRPTQYEVFYDGQLQNYWPSDGNHG